ncbi:ABC transporter substrate-binding protein [Streptomyces aidingensis]|uniref:Extracellular solute-binding protein, family 5 Middle n=1 Tax=Streptomyces aidingensis TaxID=910347 RepID=A0A1I1ESX3_9ACTN|nr:ABC transporter substrate-binding protein [Streptomyces aidingensis]SFB90229.1 extracellular solute-binding protein, family 5 Middle [Streptomyces aidingensis]
MSGWSAIGTAARRGALTRGAALLAAGALLLLPAMAGCSGGDDGEAVPLRSLATADRAALRSGGTVTWAVDAPPATLNAFQHEADRTTDLIAGAVLPMLFVLDERGRPQLNPDYLESAEITAREPKQTVVFTLNPKAKWSDGSRIGAEDFIAQWKALNGQDAAYWSARNTGYDKIENVEAGRGKNEVLVTFARPYADWRSLFTPLYPSSVTGEAKTFNEGAKDELPLSGGPFQVKAVDARKGTVTLVRNGKWWGDPALLEELVFAAVPAGRRVEALAAGAVQIAEVSPAEADRIEANASGGDAADASGGDAARGPGGGTDVSGGEAVRGTEEEGGGRAGSGGAVYSGRVRSGRAEAADPGSDPGMSAAEAPGPDAGAFGGQAEALGALHRLAEAELAVLDGDGEPADAERAAEHYADSVAAAWRARDEAFAARERAMTEGLGRYTVHRAFSASYTQLAMNGTSEALEDERVRWALARALDRAELAALVHEPAGLPVRPLGSHLWVMGQDGYQDNSSALGETGVAAAAALLEEAGWRRGTGKDPGTDAGTEADTDTDPGTEADTEADTDTEADADPGTDAGTEADAGADTEPDAGAEADTDTGEGGPAGEADDADAKPGDVPGTGTAAAGARPPAAALADGWPLVGGPVLRLAAADRTGADPAGGLAARVLPRLDTVQPGARQRAVLLRQAAGAGWQAAAEAERAGEDDTAARLRISAVQSEAGAARAADEADEMSRQAASGVRTKDGVPLRLEFVLPAGDEAEQLREVGEHIAAMLAPLGVLAEIIEVDGAAYFEDHIIEGDFDLALYSWPASAYPATDARPVYAKPQAIPGGELFVEQNFARVGTDHIDQLLYQAATELDDERRAELLNKADVRLWAAAGSIPLFQRPELVAVDRELAGAGAFGLATPRYQDIGYRR